MNDATRTDWYLYFINKKRNAENNQKRKNRLFFGHEYALTYDDCCNGMSFIAHSCGPSKHKEPLSELSRKFRGVSCPELSFINHDIATSHGCHIGYIKLNDVPI